MFEFIVISICLILNAVFSCVEMAFVTVSRPYLKKLAGNGDRLAQRLINLRANPERVLSVLQIGITLVGAISAAVGGAGAEESLSPWIKDYFGVSEDFSETLAIIAVVLPITYLSVVIGELVPKSLALKSPLKFAKLGALFLIPLDKFFSPIVFLLEISTKLVIRPLLKNLIPDSTADRAAAIDLDALSESHKQYVLNLIDVDKRKVKDILLPWESVTKVDKNVHHTEIMNLIRDSRHTRIPVTESDVPIGILHAKEFISEIEVSKINWNQLIRPLIKISSEEPILAALKTLQANKGHMGVVYKKDVVMGIVTLEDIFEEVVGEIYDEDDNMQTLLSTNSKIRTMGVPKK